MSRGPRDSAILASTALMALTVCAAVTVAGLAGVSTVHPRIAPDNAEGAGRVMNADWSRFGNTADNARFSPLTAINSGNVSGLGIAWTMPQGSGQTTWETNPVVVGGIMYLTTSTDQVRAVNAATGMVRWTYTPAVDFYNAVAGGGGGAPANRGVTVAGGRVYLLTFDDRLVALRASTGAKLWATTVADARVGYSETSPPTYWNGLLFLGGAEGDAGLRGFVAAYDALTGKPVWRFYTVPAPGHGWMPAQGAHGGGDVWMPPTIDPTTGILYAGTGNPSPDFVNADRPGCNPWVDAAVALDARTGKLVWARTQVCPDLWDYDSDQAPVLFTLRKGGKTIRAVGLGNKGGHYWIFDAATGRTLAVSPALARETLPRPAPNATGVTVCPGDVGGIAYSPPAYSPLTHALYQPALDLCMVYTADPRSGTRRHQQGAVDLGGAVFLAAVPQAGYMAAVDVDTGKMRWRTRVARPMVGGALATAGNLVFGGADDGQFYAFDARTGRILWLARLGLAFGAAPIAYAVDGTEYVAIAVGGSAVAAIDGAPTGGTLVVFRLGGAPPHRLPAVQAGPILTGDAAPSVRGLTRLNRWMYAGARARRTVITLVAGETPTNSGFNFDGYSGGHATFVVPRGWTVELEFSNKSALPHSAALASSLGVPSRLPLFDGAPAATAHATAGIGAGVVQVVRFRAARVGTYYLICAVPGHVQTGMWDYLTISPTAAMPTLRFR